METSGSRLHKTLLNKLSKAQVRTVQQPGTLITIPISVPPAVDIAVHYEPGNAIWFTEVANNRVRWTQSQRKALLCTSLLQEYHFIARFVHTTK
jgi:hypothetical protein